MSAAITKVQVEKIIREQWGLDDDESLNPKRQIDDLGVDSLDRADFILVLENEFKLPMAPDGLEDAATIGELLEGIEAWARASERECTLTSASST